MADRLTPARDWTGGNSTTYSPATDLLSTTTPRNGSIPGTGCGMAYSSFQHSDLTRPWARRRAGAWIAVCLAFTVGLVVVAASRGDWYPVLMAVFFASQVVLTARRLTQHRRLSRDATGSG
jgi:hypothetical protein